MELDRMLKVLGEPMRLKIYQALLERKHCVRSLSKKFGISESAISQHMKVMKDAGLVSGKDIPSAVVALVYRHLYHHLSIVIKSFVEILSVDTPCDCYEAFSF